MVRDTFVHGSWKFFERAGPSNRTSGNGDCHRLIWVLDRGIRKVRFFTASFCVCTDGGCEGGTFCG